MSVFNPTKLIKLDSIELLSSELYPQIHENMSDMDHPAQVVNNFKFKCTICPLKFNEKQEFHSHVRGHFKSFECEKCEKTLIGDKQYDYHMKHVHCGKKKISERRGNKNVSKLNIRKGDLQTNEHFQNEDAEDMNDDDSLEVVNSNRSVKNESSVACDVCGRLFPNDAAVMRHKKTHSLDEKRFICGFCGNGFNKKTNLEFHMRIHTNERPFACDQCPKSFAHVSGLNCHRRVHSGEKPYKCPFCEKRYAHSTDLRRHRRTHGLEQKRFKCSLCEKQFYEKKFLRSHMSSHHRDRDRRGVKSTYFEKDLTTDIEIIKMEESTNEEYIDYEYIHSD